MISTSPPEPASPVPPRIGRVDLRVEYREWWWRKRTLDIPEFVRGLLGHCNSDRPAFTSCASCPGCKLSVSHYSYVIWTHLLYFRTSWFLQLEAVSIGEITEGKFPIQFTRTRGCSPFVTWSNSRRFWYPIWRMWGMDSMARTIPGKMPSEVALKALKNLMAAAIGWTEGRVQPLTGWLTTH